MRIFLTDAIYIKGKEWRIVCDSTKSKYYPLVFYSHAHSDHIPRKIPNTDIICSEETRILINNLLPNSRDKKFYNAFSLEETIFSQKPSGHIVGSTALIIESTEGKVVYTGDVSSRDKGFIDPFIPEKCDKLIIESTFGSPTFEFPEFAQTIKITQEIIEKYLNEEIPVILMGYALGKAQMLYHAFSHLSENIILHGSNHKINSILCKFNLEGKIQGKSYQEAKKNNLLESKQDWIMFSPLKSGRDSFNTYLRKKYKAKLFAFSGWCISKNYKFRMDVDHAVTMSDHADFNELIDICEKSNPSEIYTIYGYNQRFAAELRKRGFVAYPLSKQTILDTFI